MEKIRVPSVRRNFWRFFMFLLSGGDQRPKRLKELVSSAVVVRFIRQPSVLLLQELQFSVTEIYTIGLTQDAFERLVI